MDDAQRFANAAERGTPWVRGGTTRTRARRWLSERTEWPTPCARCGEPVSQLRWHLGHRRDRQAHPELTWEPANWQVEHPRCSLSSGATQGNVRRGIARRSRGGPAGSGGKQSAPLTAGVAVGSVARTVPVTLSLAPRTPGALDGLPSFFVAPHPEAVGSRGDEFVAAAEARRGQPLRWWQWVSAQRRYEVREDGTWCWLLVWTSVARQLGKSVELAEDAAWFGSLPGQSLHVHAANRVKTSLAVQADLWSWAEASGLSVARLLGDSRITWPDGSMWRTLALLSAYGARPHRVSVDEAWAMTAEPFWSSLFPALGAADNAQCLMWSCANDGARDLAADMRTDPQVCRMEWGALPGEDPEDPRTWRAASAYWAPGRERLMTVGVSRPAFAANWLNRWPEPRDSLRWLPARLTEPLPRRGRVLHVPPAGAVCAVECSLDGDRWAVAAAWQAGRLMCVRVWEADSLTECLRIVGERPVYAHTAVAERVPVAARHHVRPVSAAQARAATDTLRQAVRSGDLALDGITDETWAAVVCTPADGGEIVDARRSRGDVQAVKAAAWSVWGLESGANRSGFVFGLPAAQSGA